MKTWHIHIRGQVQGVGFRPFVYRLALEHGLNGWVNNTVDGVHIEVNAPVQKARSFYRDVLQKAPALSKITAQEMVGIAPAEFERFEIRHSDSAGSANLLLTPDFAMCDDCRRELQSKDDRREGYPFITCTNCGPRFSIIRSLPYDRETTTMEPFVMCPACAKEYSDPFDRRYYSQTNSCPDCPVELALFSGRQRISADPEKIAGFVSRFWKAGEIVAIKGIGGYLLTCDARNALAVGELRRRKARPTKPFALMYPELSVVLRQFDLRKSEVEVLSSTGAPIVLLPLPPGRDLQIATEAIAPGLDQVGVMLPYTPLYEMLMHGFERPVVATSGNISNAPIVYRDEVVFDEFEGIADHILMNDREIVLPQDDSVLKFSPVTGQKIVLRRSRGIAPTFINASLSWPEETILCMGAMLKSTFTYLHQGNTYISQYLGDLDDYGTQQSYRHTIQHFIQVFGASPSRIIVDKHPDYPSTRYGRQLAGELNVPCKSVQHHMAHFAAVLAEHNRLDTREPVLGVIWDGTGYGDDGQIWGGEFFRYQDRSFSRHKAFSYFSHILGDKMAREPRIPALSACWNIDGAEAILRPKFSDTEWKLYSGMLSKGGGLQTSSVGRLFDAVASLLGVMDVQTYEGEAAMRLEALAQSYFLEHGSGRSNSYLSGELLGDKVPTKQILAALLHDVQRGISRAQIAANFHFTLVEIIRSVASESGTGILAFSGGVWQNSLLVDFVVQKLGDDFELLFHREIAPNDEGVSFGQLVCGVV